MAPLPHKRCALDHNHCQYIMVKVGSLKFLFGAWDEKWNVTYCNKFSIWEELRKSNLNLARYCFLRNVFLGGHATLNVISHYTFTFKFKPNNILH